MTEQAENNAIAPCNVEEYRGKTMSNHRWTRHVRQLGPLSDAWAWPRPRSREEDARLPSGQDRCCVSRYQSQVFGDCEDLLFTNTQSLATTPHTCPWRGTGKQIKLLIPLWAL